MAPSISTDASGNRYHKVCSGAGTRRALATGSSSYQRARSEHATFAPLSVLASAPPLRTPPASPDAANLMKHVLTALRSSLVIRVSRSSKDRPGIDALPQQGAADGCSTLASSARRCSPSSTAVSRAARAGQCHCHASKRRRDAREKTRKLLRPQSWSNAAESRCGGRVIDPAEVRRLKSGGPSAHFSSLQRATLVSMPMSDRRSL